jgi:DNA-binding MarR family transcriptional regulator
MSNPPACIDLSQNLGTEITRMALWNHRIERLLAVEGGLPVNELHCILQLYLETPPSATALSDLLGIRDSSLSKLLRNLERRGAILRADDPLDRRIERVHLTDSGTRIAVQSIARASAIGARVLAELPEERRAQFVRCLGVMTTIGSSIIAPGTPPDETNSTTPPPTTQG